MRDVFQLPSLEDFCANVDFKLTVKQLRDRLRELGLPVGGIKTELVKRLGTRKLDVKQAERSAGNALGSYFSETTVLLRCKQQAVDLAEAKWMGIVSKFLISPTASN